MGGNCGCRIKSTEGEYLSVDVVKGYLRRMHKLSVCILRCWLWPDLRGDVELPVFHPWGRPGGNCSTKHQPPGSRNLAIRREDRGWDAIDLRKPKLESLPCEEKIHEKPFHFALFYFKRIRAKDLTRITTRQLLMSGRGNKHVWEGLSCLYINV